MIPLDLIPQGGAVGLLALVVILIITGRLVPRSALLDAREQRDRWRDAALKAMEQNAELLTGARVASDVMKVLPEAKAGEPA